MVGVENRLCPFEAVDIITLKWHFTAVQEFWDKNKKAVLVNDR
jgi:hypothetical protein